MRASFNVTKRAPEGCLELTFSYMLGEAQRHIVVIYQGPAHWTMFHKGDHIIDGRFDGWAGRVSLGGGHWGPEMAPSQVLRRLAGFFAGRGLDETWAAAAAALEEAGA